MNIKINKKLLLLSVLFWLVPFFSQAADLNKGLFETTNLQETQKFIQGGGVLAINPPDYFPIPMFMVDAGRSTEFLLNTNKAEYKPGETIEANISAKSILFNKKLHDYQQNVSIYYIWAAGNFYAEIYRLDDTIKNGEYLVASGKIYPENNISLFQNEKKNFNFSWKIPSNAKKGTYEFRIYPTSEGNMFLGSPEAYRSLLKTRISINSEADKENKVGWDERKIKLDDNPLIFRYQTTYLESGKDYNLSIPLKNSGEEIKEVSVVKQILQFAPSYGGIVSEETEKFSLGPGEEKIISYKLSKSNIKGEPDILVRFAFSNSNGNPLPTGINYFDYPLSSSGDESVIIPLYIKNNFKYMIIGEGIETKNSTPGFIKGSTLTSFVEVSRLDPLFYYSQEKERAKEDNIKVELTLSDRQGNIIDEYSFDGPSWNRSGKLFKPLSLVKNFDYLKLTGILSSKSQGIIEKKELEYNFSLPPQSTIEKIKELVDEYKILLAFSIVIIIIGLLLFVFLKSKQKNELSGY